MNRQELRVKVRRAVDQLVLERGFVSPLDVFLRLGKITPKLVEEWRFGRVAYLERVLHGNLAQFSFIMSIIREKARELDLKQSHTSYTRWGKGPKQPLRFSKSNDPKIERYYATHFVAKKVTLPMLQEDLQQDSKSK